MTEEWLEHVDLPEGQSADLLKRYPYERATMIELAAERDMAVTQALLREGGAKSPTERQSFTNFADVVLRASLWEAKLKHALTGADIDASQFGMAKDSVVKELRDHAVVNYIAWFDEAYAGPKGSSETDSPTPTSENPEPSATSASTPSAAGSPQAETS